MRKLLYLFALLGTISLAGVQADGGMDSDDRQEAPAQGDDEAFMPGDGGGDGGEMGGGEEEV